MARKSKPIAHAPQLLKVLFESRPDTPFYYVNYMAVGHNATDFTISAIRVGDFQAEQMEHVRAGKPVTLEPTLQLIAPPMVAKGLAAALTDQIAKYEAQFGKIPVLTPEGKVSRD